MTIIPFSLIPITIPTTAFQSFCTKPWKKWLSIHFLFNPWQSSEKSIKSKKHLVTHPLAIIGNKEVFVLSCLYSYMCMYQSFWKQSSQLVCIEEFDAMIWALVSQPTIFSERFYISWWFYPDSSSPLKNKKHHENVPDIRKDLHLGLDLLNTYPFLRNSPIPIYLLMLSPPTNGDCPSLPAPSSCPLMPPHPRSPSTGEASALAITPAPFPYLSFYGEHKNQTVFRHSHHTSLSLSLSVFLLPPNPILYSNFFLYCFFLSMFHYLSHSVLSHTCFLRLYF